MIDQTLKLTVPTFEGKSGRAGYQDPDEWRAYVDWAVANEVLPEPVDVDEVITNEYLPS